MKKMLTLAFSLGLILQLNAQSNVPSSLAGNDGSGSQNYYKLRENYLNISNSEDSIAKKQKKEADRWFFENLPYLNVKSDCTFTVESINKLMYYYIPSEYFCSEDNKSDWSSLGPVTSPTQQGWVSAVTKIPELNGRILMGSRMNGIFMLENETSTNWICVTDNLPYPVLGITNIIVDPLNFNHVIATTGTRSGYQDIQTGVMHSWDGGATWTDHIVAVENQIINTIVDIQYVPNHSNYLIAITEKSIYYSYDNGLSWYFAPLPTSTPPFHSFMTLTITESGKILIPVENDYGISAFLLRGTLDLSNEIINWDNAIINGEFNLSANEMKAVNLGENLYQNDNTKYDCVSEPYPLHPLFNIGHWPNIKHLGLM
ncbi:MAG: hypothetical protein ACK46Y_04940 [Fluviicola sp.]